MQYRTLGKTGLSVSEIGYGGGRVRPEHDETSLVNMLHYAMDSGLNYLDTAPIMGVATAKRLSVKRSLDGGNRVSSRRRRKPMIQMALR